MPPAITRRGYELQDAHVNPSLKIALDTQLDFAHFGLAQNCENRCESIGGQFSIGNFPLGGLQLTGVKAPKMLRRHSQPIESSRIFVSKNGQSRDQDDDSFENKEGLER